MFFRTNQGFVCENYNAGNIGLADWAFAVQQLNDRAVASAEIVDILKSAGIDTPDISILSDEFLAEIQNMEYKNPALETLKKLINGEIRSRGKTNLVESKKFSNRLKEAMARYHANAISAVEMIQELISIAKGIKSSRMRGEEQGLSQEEIAFYDALAQNDTVIEAMGSDKLRVIAHDLVKNLQSNVSVDWRKRESARARMSILV